MNGLLFDVSLAIKGFSKVLKENRTELNRNELF